MAFIDHEKKEINCKVVYYGAGMVGKSTSMQYIYDKVSVNNKGKFISLATETDRTLFFDFINPDKYEVEGYKIRFHLYTVPGAVFYDKSRQRILKGADGVIFVVDSQVERKDSNYELLYNLECKLKLQGYEVREMPYVLQINKRDLSNAITVEEAVREFRLKDEPIIESVAYKGIGVQEAFESIAEQIIEKLKRLSISKIKNRGKNASVTVEYLNYLVELSKEDKREMVRYGAVEILGELGNQETFDLVLPALKDESHHVRFYAVHALGKLDGLRAIETLIECLDDKVNVVRSAAARSLGVIGNKRVVKVLIEKLKDSDGMVCIAAAEALGNLADVQAIEHLLPLLKEECGNTFHSVAVALKKLGWLPPAKFKEVSAKNEKYMRRIFFDK